MPNPISTIPGQQSASQYGFTDPYATAPEHEQLHVG